VSVASASQTIDLQTLYNVQGWNPYAVSFNADEDMFRLVFKNPGMEDDPTCGPIIDNIAIKKLFTPDKPKGIYYQLNAHYCLSMNLSMHLYFAENTCELF